MSSDSSAASPPLPPQGITVDEHSAFMRAAVEASFVNMRSGTGTPFGCAIVAKGGDGKGRYSIVATAANEVFGTNDPTAHAEMVAIRAACKALGRTNLEGCILYASGQPCPMCVGAIYWARPDAVYYSNHKDEAAKIGFGTDHVQRSIEAPLEKGPIPFVRFIDDEAINAFNEWAATHPK